MTPAERIALVWLLWIALFAAVVPLHAAVLLGANAAACHVSVLTNSRPSVGVDGFIARPVNGWEKGN